MTDEIYIPVPMLNERGEWEPVDKRTGEAMPWLDGFDPATLPVPRYRLGDSVGFAFGKEYMTGVVREVSLGGGLTGRITPWKTLAERITEAYDRKSIQYTIHARGHGRWVWEKDVF